MDKILIRGGRPLRGKVQVRGAKNATLPIMAAAILAEQGPCVLHNVPCLHDVFSMDKILGEFGISIDFTGRCMTIDAQSANSWEAGYDLVRRMRASFFVLGPLLGRFGKAKVSLPGGCAIGTRPVDIHLKGLRALGAAIDIEEGCVIAQGELHGADISLDFPSVGATENLMMAASRAKGVTRLSNVAREPEITDLARFLNAMGGRISGAGTDLITVVGVDTLTGAQHEIIPDRIEAATFLLAGAATRGEVTVLNANAEHLTAFIRKLQEAQIGVEVEGSRITVNPCDRCKAVDIVTQPFPGFPTDLQAQTMALMCVADGVSVIKETVFENRFMQVAELVRMGAEIDLDGNSAVVRGVSELRGAPVMASDLRASAALVVAGLAAGRGETAISRVYHIDRGYERIDERLASLGADIERVREG